MSKRISRNNQISRVKQLVLGTQKHFANGSQPLTVAGATSTVADLTALMQSFVDNQQAVEAAKAAAKAKIETQRAQAPSQNAVINAFETIVRGMFGTSADVLADFGLSLHKARVPMTAEKKAVATAKRLATRAARHVMGKNQRKIVKGAVNAALVVTNVQGSQPTTPPSAPASNAPSGTTPHGQ